MAAKYTRDEVWSKLGFSFRPLGSKVCVVTDPPELKVGSLFLPMSQTSFYSDLPHLKLVRCSVLSVGPKAKGITPGARITFQRTCFIRLYHLEPQVLVGLVDASQVYGRFTTDDEEAEAASWLVPPSERAAG